MRTFDNSVCREFLDEAALLVSVEIKVKCICCDCNGQHNRQQRQSHGGTRNIRLYMRILLMSRRGHIVWFRCHSQMALMSPGSAAKQLSTTKINEHSGSLVVAPLFLVFCAHRFLPAYPSRIIVRLCALLSNTTAVSWLSRTAKKKLPGPIMPLLTVIKHH